MDERPWRARRSGAASPSRLSFSAPGLTMRREVIGVMSSTATRSLARSVLPVETRSTITSASPTSGANSIDPYRRMTSTCMPFCAKCSRAVFTYLVATRMRAPRCTVPAQSNERRVATTMRQRPIPRSTRLVEAFAAVLEQHVLAGDARVGRAVLHVGRHVRWTHHEEADVGVARREDQLARSLGILVRDDARLREQRQRLVEDAALGERDGERGQGGAGP